LHKLNFLLDPNLAKYNQHGQKFGGENGTLISQKLLFARSLFGFQIKGQYKYITGLVNTSKHTNKTSRFGYGKEIGKS